MVTTLTQATVWSEFTQVCPANVSAPLLPVIVGPQAVLHRYDVPTEKAAVSLGAYVPGSDTNYAWPDQAVDSVIDLGYFALFIDSAWLNYFNHAIGGGGYTVAPVNGFQNQIKRNDSYGWKANGSSYPRDPALGDRDVKVGDIVKVSQGGNSLVTSVAGFVANTVAASIASATSDSNNAATQSANTSHTQTGGTVNDVDISTVNGSGYDGTPSGFLNETYTITVTQGSTGGNATTALLNVVSGSGLDNASNVAPSAFGSPTAIGARGLLVTWSHTTANFVPGQVWSVTVSQVWTAPVPTSGGTFTGPATCTYIVKVAVGGLYTDSTQPQITVTNDIGTDTSGPTTVTAAATAVAVGTAGVTIKFSGTGLRKGDLYYIVATAAGSGSYQTIVLNNIMSSALLSQTDLNVLLAIQENIVVPEDAINNPPNVNWALSQSQITVKAGMEATDPSLTSGGAQVYVPVVSGPSTLMYAQYREWVPTLTNTFNQLAVPAGTLPAAIQAAVQAAVGTVTPDNPLAFGLYLALLNANGQPVAYTSVIDPSVTNDWALALEVLTGQPVYSIVPLTTTPAVQTLFSDFVAAQSATATNGAWCRTWLTIPAVDSSALISQSSTTDHNPALGTLTANPAIVQTQYTYLTLTSGNANFTTAGIQPGDVVRYLFTVDSFGNPEYTAFVVAQVLSADTLLVQAPGNGSPVSVAQKFEIWRNYSKDQIAANLVTAAQGHANKGVLVMWPDLVEVEQTANEVPGYFLSCVYAGFTAGVMPHQGIKGIPVTGIKSVNRSTSFFNNFQLNTLASGGVFTVTQDTAGDVFARDCVTTDTSTLENNLEVVQRDEDTIRHVLFNGVQSFFGVSSNTSATAALIRSQLNSDAQTLQSFTFISRLGNMMSGFSIDDLRPSLVNPDNLICQATAEVPFPINDFNLILTFSVFTG